MTNAIITRNTEKNGIEITFTTKPAQIVLDTLKSAGYRWHNVKKLWYAKANEKTENAAKSITDGANIETATETTTKAKKSALAPLFERLTYTEGTNPDECHAHTVGSRYTKGLTNKEIAATVKKHLSERFPECKFSATSIGWNSVNIYIKKSQFAKDSAELDAVLTYAKKYLASFNYDDSDSMTDYFDTNFCDFVSTYDFEQIEIDDLKEWLYNERDRRNSLTAQKDRLYDAIGEKITVCKIDETFGMVQTSSMMLDDVEICNYAQYSECLKLFVKLPRKRGLYSKTLTPSSCFIIVKGAFSFPDSVLYDTTETKDLVCKMPKYHSCDRRQIQDIKKYAIKNGFEILVDRSEA